MAASKKNSSIYKKIVITLGIVVVIVVGLVSFQLYRGYNNLDRVEKTVTNFLLFASANDIDEAYLLTSKQFKKDVSKQDLEELFAYTQAQYTGIIGVKRTGFKISSDTSGSTLYQYVGIVMYDDGDEGEMVAVLQEEGGEWKILQIQVNATLERVKKFNQDPQERFVGGE